MSFCTFELHGLVDGRRGNGREPDSTWEERDRKEKLFLLEVESGDSKSGSARISDRRFGATAGEPRK